jgi:NTP pyrophosphatase (non-canonical NTP hydrolase)
MDFRKYQFSFRKYQFEANATNITGKAVEQLMNDRTAEEKESLFNLLYLTSGLVGEAGEVANKVKKILRDDYGKLTPQRRIELVLELGDVLWYVSEICTHLGIPLEKVASDNIHKLGMRKYKGMIGGSGDGREQGG